MTAEAWHASLSAVTFAFLICITTFGLLRVPSPQTSFSDSNRFAEGRALKHAAYLSEDIGNRIVGTPNVEVAAQYVLSQATEIADLATSHPHLTAVVDREQVSGGFNAHFAGVAIASAYQNLTNVMLYISPKHIPQSQQLPALLLNSHFDSVFGTKGASDCASCVGVMLEIARTLLSDKTTDLKAPVLFLFNGGEESLLLASHGFMAHSKWASKLGAFINLESTGPGGPAYLFQHTGGWTSKAYADAARHPHGSVVGQDFFDSRILAMDTDFRIFSAQHHGNLPGIDLAYILDGAAYHTNQDTVARIRKGTVQASGENILAAVHKFTDVLGSGKADLLGDNDVFFDVLGWIMVSYPWWLGKILHTAPLVLVISTLLWKQGGKLESDEARVTPWAIVGGALLCLTALVGAVLLGGISGLLRAALSGKSLIWFGKPAVLFGIYGPTALAGLLLPYLAFWKGKPGLKSRLLGHSLIFSVIAALLTQINGRSGFMFAAWGICSLLASSVVPEQGRNSSFRMLLAYAITTPAVFLTAPLITTLTVFIMEHISISGSPPPPFGFLVGDVVLGAVCGLSFFAAASFHTTCFAHNSRSLLKKSIAILLATSVAVSLFSSAFQTAYSTAHPKRVLLQHLHEMDGSGQAVSSRWSVAGLDPIPVEKVLPSNSVILQSRPTEWQALYPLSRLLRGISLEAPPPDQTLLSPNESPFSISLIKRDKQKAGLERWHLELQAARPPWGTFNVTGGLQGWSFADSLQKSDKQSIGYMVRFASNDRKWPFWLDVKAGSEIEIAAAILFMDESPTIEGFSQSFPSWVNVMPLTGFQAKFHFQ